MSDPSQGALPADDANMKDRKVGLVFFGLVQIALGGVFGLMALFQVLIPTVQPPGLDQGSAMGAPGTVLYLVAFFASLAVVLVWLGVGSVLKRRWAQALSLVGGWLWLIFGAAGLLGMILFMPDFSEALREGSADSTFSEDQMAMFGTVMKTVMIVFQSIFLVILPGIIVLFYRSPHVRATCESHDPEVRWTDQCPLPVLALILLLGSGAYQCVLTGLSPFRMLPLFGTLIQGMLATVLLVGFGLILIYLTRGIYRMDLRAWWATVGLCVLFLISSIITFLRISPTEILEAMRMPEAQLETMASVYPETPTMLLFICIGGAVWLGFLWYLKRYFPESQVLAPDSSVRAPSV